MPDLTPARVDEPCPACGYPRDWFVCDYCPDNGFAHPECLACGGDGGWWECEWCEMTRLAEREIWGADLA